MLSWLPTPAPAAPTALSERVAQVAKGVATLLLLVSLLTLVAKEEEERPVAERAPPFGRSVTTAVWRTTPPTVRSRVDRAIQPTEEAVSEQPWSSSEGIEPVEKVVLVWLPCLMVD